MNTAGGILTMEHLMKVIREWQQMNTAGGI